MIVCLCFLLFMRHNLLGSTDLACKKHISHSFHSHSPVFAVEGGWSNWGPYSKCSRTCGSGGTQTRYRTCSSPHAYYAYGGSSCRGYSKQTRKCGGNIPCRKGDTSFVTAH